MKYFFILIVFFFQFINVFSQKSSTDSLKEQLDTLVGIQRVDVLNQLALEYVKTAPQEAVKYADEALNISGIKLDDITEANLYNSLATAYYYLGDLGSATKYYKKELKIIENKEADKKLLISYYNLGTIYKQLDKNHRSLKFYLQSLDLAKEMKMEDLMVQNYHALSVVASELWQYKDALAYYKRYIKLRDSIFYSITEEEITVLRANYERAKKVIKKKTYQLKEADKKEKILKEDVNKKKGIIDELATENVIKDSTIVDKNRAILEKEREIWRKQQKVIYQKQLIFILSISFGIVIVFALMYYWQYRKSKKMSQNLSLINSEIKNQKAEIEAQRDEIEDQRNYISKQNDELKELNITKDKFFSIIAHDLKNPFNNLIGLSGLLVSDYDEMEQERIKKFHGYIHDSAEQAYNLLENLLQWSRTQTNTIKLEPEKFAIFDVINENVKLLQSNAENKKITIQTEADYNLKVFADKNMTNTILRNLISNALKFTPKEGKITVSAIEKNEMVKISVKDTGIGIPEEKIKDLFFMGKNTSTKGTNNEAGTGLGLILCKEFVHKNKGEIFVESQRGKGSIFNFTLSKNEFF